MPSVIRSACSERFSARSSATGFGNVLSARSAALDTLSFSREQEYQADTLGLHYMTAAGYDPARRAGILAALSAQTALEARVQGRTNRQTPEWASTHPLSENRMQRALAEARATGRLGSGMRNRDTFLSELEGIYVDDDPAQGVIDGATFTHPDLRIQFSVPQGYLMQNGTDAVTYRGLGREGAVPRRSLTGNLDNAILAASSGLTDGQMRLQRPAAAAYDRQRHACRVHHGSRTTPIPGRSTPACSPINGTPRACFISSC